MFNESEWLKLVFLLADTQEWLDDMVKQAVGSVPLEGKKNFLKKSYCLSVRALAHILERHYYKIPRHPHTGKFHIPVQEILQLLREAHTIEPVPVPGKNIFMRKMQTEKAIGFDKTGTPACHICVLTDAGGKIITAFPGSL